MGADESGFGVQTAASVPRERRLHTEQLVTGQSEVKHPLPCSSQPCTPLCAAPVCLQLEVSADTEDDLVRWDGWVSSRIRRLMEALQDSVRVRWEGVAGERRRGTGSTGGGVTGPGRWLGTGQRVKGNGRQRAQCIPASACASRAMDGRGRWLWVLC